MLSSIILHLPNAFQKLNHAPTVLGWTAGHETRAHVAIYFLPGFFCLPLFPQVASLPGLSHPQDLITSSRFKSLEILACAVMLASVK